MRPPSPSTFAFGLSGLAAYQGRNTLSASSTPPTAAMISELAMRRMSIDARTLSLLLVASPPCRSSAGRLTLPFAGVPLRDHRAARRGRRGGRLRRPVERRDDRPRRLHAARARGGVDRADAPRHRRRERVHARARRCWPSTRRRCQDASRRALLPRHRLVVERDRRALERQIPFEKPLTQGARDGRGRCARCSRGERGPGGFKLETPPEPPPPIYIAALRGRMLRARRRDRRRHVRELPAALGRREGDRRDPRGRARGRQARGRLGRAVPLLLHPAAAEEGLPLARWMFSAYATVPVYEAFFRWLGWGEAIDPMVEAWNEPATASARSSRARGPDPRDLHLRLARRAEARGSGSSSRGGITTPVLTPIAGPTSCRG